MKKIIVVFLLVGSLSQIVSAQTDAQIETENKVTKHFYFGIGFGIGFFHPSDVNDYIKDFTSNYMITGIEDLILNFIGRVSFTYRINKTVDLTFLGEYAWAPKYILVSGGDDEYFHFDRISPGFIPKFHLPIGSGKHSIFIAPGLLYNFMKFEKYKANGFGGRLEIGFSLNPGKKNIQPFVCFDYSKAIDDSYYSDFELNYSGVQIGVDFNF